MNGPVLVIIVAGVQIYWAITISFDNQNMPIIVWVHRRQLNIMLFVSYQRDYIVRPIQRTFLIRRASRIKDFNAQSKTRESTSVCSASDVL